LHCYWPQYRRIFKKSYLGKKLANTRNANFGENGQKIG